METVKICYERIIPKELDPLHKLLIANRDIMKASTLFVTKKQVLDAIEIARIDRMALIDTKKWKSGDTLNCRFLDGSSKMKKKTEDIAHQWEDHANIKLKFIDSGPAEIRISFCADRGSWSMLGQDALVTEYIPLHQPTMNYGWLRDDTIDAEYLRVVLHEFGHALGCIHEHQSPTFNRTWNMEMVNKYFQGPPNFWKDETIESNVIGKYSSEGISATRFDPESIMLYAFDGVLFSDGLGPTNTNNTLSEKDIEMIKFLYPF
jgi:hypothetical protein